MRLLCQIISQMTDNQIDNNNNSWQLVAPRAD